MVTMIVSSGSITVSVSVVTSSVALVPLFSVTTGVIGMKSVAAVAVPVMVSPTCTSPPVPPPLKASLTVPPSFTIAPPRDRDLGEISRGQDRAGRRGITEVVARAVDELHQQLLVAFRGAVSDGGDLEGELPGAGRDRDVPDRCDDVVSGGEAADLDRELDRARGVGVDLDHERCRGALDGPAAHRPYRQARQGPALARAGPSGTRPSDRALWCAQLRSDRHCRGVLRTDRVTARTRLQAHRDRLGGLFACARVLTGCLPLCEREAGLFRVQGVDRARAVPGGREDLLELANVGAFRSDVERAVEGELARHRDGLASVAPRARPGRPRPQRHHQEKRG